MKTYEVICDEVRRFTVTVEAEHEDQAKELVNEDVKKTRQKNSSKYKNVIDDGIVDWEIFEVIEQETS